jgi:hypothetical protein
MFRDYIFIILISVGSDNRCTAESVIEEAFFHNSGKFSPNFHQSCLPTLGICSVYSKCKSICVGAAQI